METLINKTLPRQHIWPEKQPAVNALLKELHNAGCGYCFGHYAAFQYRVKRSLVFTGNLEFWLESPFILGHIKSLGYNYSLEAVNIITDSNDIKLSKCNRYRIYNQENDFYLDIHIPIHAKSPWEFRKDIWTNKVYWDKEKGWAPTSDVADVIVSEIENKSYTYDIGTPQQDIAAMNIMYPDSEFIQEPFSNDMMSQEEFTKYVEKNRKRIEQEIKEAKAIEDGFNRTVVLKVIEQEKKKPCRDL